MSTATAAPEAGAAAPKGGKKKLMIIIGAVVLLLLVGGGGAAYVMMKNKAAAAAAAEAEGEDGGKAGKKEAKGTPAQVRDPKAVPTFIPLDPFTVNLADRDAERYAQVGIALEMEDVKQGDAVKAYMPVIRNNILMLLSHKTAAELMEREGKEKLAQQIRKETSRALGVEVDDEEEEDPKPKKKKKRPPVQLPVTAVHFSNFIIQ